MDLGIENLEKVIKLHPEECRQIAKTDSDFDKIRDDLRFVTLIFQ